MSDVGRVAKVSASTVSHVINKTRKVDPATEKAVLAAIESTGYWGDGIARSLRKGTTQTVGLAMSAISNPYFGALVHAIERNVSAAGYSLLLADTHDDPAREFRAVKDLLSHRVDAVIVAPSADSGAALDLVARRGVPLVLIDRALPVLRPGMDSIGVVNDEPNAKLVDHFARLGHTRIATITGKPGLSTTVERLDGFTRGISRNGLLYDPDLIKSYRDEEGSVDEALRELFALSSPPTAVIMGNNLVTISAMRGLRKLGLEVPRDIPIACFDDFEWADVFHPRLTAVSQPVDEIGSRAVAMLLERLLDQSLPSRHERIEPQLFHRESCGCLNDKSF